MLRPIKSPLGLLFSGLRPLSIDIPDYVTKSTLVQQPSREWDPPASTFVKVGQRAGLFRKDEWFFTADVIFA